MPVRSESLLLGATAKYPRQIAIVGLGAFHPGMGAMLWNENPNPAAGPSRLHGLKCCSFLS